MCYYISNSLFGSQMFNGLNIKKYYYKELSVTFKTLGRVLYFIRKPH